MSIHSPTEWTKADLLLVILLKVDLGSQDYDPCQETLLKYVLNRICIVSEGTSVVPVEEFPVKELGYWGEWDINYKEIFAFR